MTQEPSKAAWKRADELTELDGSYRALALYIDRVDRVAREARKGVWDAYCPGTFLDEKLAEIMLPEPEPDPLQEAMRAAYGAAAPEFVEAARNALTAAGYQITKVES